MKSSIVWSVLVLSAISAVPAARAQSVLIDALVKHWTSSKKLTLAVAEAMPDDQYSFKPTEIEMSFGHQMNHIAQANGYYCSAASGQPNPIPSKAEDTKAEAVKNLNTAFDFCIGQMQKLNDAGLLKIMGSAPKQITAFEGFWGGFTHTAHHRGQAEVYLRLKGVKPPDYVF